MVRTYHLYRIVNKLNGKAYIGWTINPGKRWRRHLNAANKPKNIIHLAMAKYGSSNFSFELIDSFEGTESEVKRKEVEQILKESTLTPGGYNMTAGGDGAKELGQLAAAAHAARRLQDAEADRAARSARTKLANSKMPPNARSEAAKRMWANRKPEVREAMRAKAKAQAEREGFEYRSARSKAYNATLTKEQLSARGKRGKAAALAADPDYMVRAWAAAEAYRATLSLEDKSRIGKLGASAYRALSPERRSEIAAKRWVTRRQREADKLQGT